MNLEEQKIQEYIRLNPGTKDDEFIHRLSGVTEWVCEHGVGHPISYHDGINKHGCDGCCTKKKMIGEKK